MTSARTCEWSGGSQSERVSGRAYLVGVGAQNGWPDMDFHTA